MRFIALLALLTSGNVLADEFSYFSNPALDFWKEGAPRLDEPRGAALSSSVKPTIDAKSNAFPWRKFLDPKNDEFFREGDYTPPAPFMEIARDPSDANIDNWFRYLELKNQLLHRLQEKLTAYAVAHPQLSAMPPEMKAGESRAAPIVEEAAAHLRAGSAPGIDAKRFRLRLYFDSHCPHCEHMISTTLPELAAMGYWIELRQVDSDERARARIPFPISRAAPDDLRRYGIESVPVLLAGDLKAKTFFKIQGDQPARAVLAALRGKGQ